MTGEKPRQTVLLLSALVIAAASLHGGPSPQPRLADVAGRTARQQTSANIPGGEEAWIAATVAAGIRGIVTAATGETNEPPMRVALAPHIWAPASYGPAVALQIANPAASEPVDHQVRTPLATLSVSTLLQENVRMSGILARDMRSPAAHESAALLVGAFALREPSGLFGDVRPALSRMTAHLAVAYAVRRKAAETLDGALARIVLSVLVGHQRTGLDALDALSPRLVTDADRAWDRALRLRITGDWRAGKGLEQAPLIERLEQARALQARVGERATLVALEPWPAKTLPTGHASPCRTAPACPRAPSIRRTSSSVSSRNPPASGRRCMTDVSRQST
jgi:hypothetical protein